MVFLRYILIIFFVYLFLSLTILRFSVVYIENNKQLLESYLSYINYNYIIKRPELKNNTKYEKDISHSFYLQPNLFLDQRFDGYNTWNIGLGIGMRL